jgi:hypothetical protein
MRHRVLLPGVVLQKMRDLTVPHTPHEGPVRG